MTQMQRTQAKAERQRKTEKKSLQDLGWYILR